jgi:hypothetical protein
MGDDDSDLLPVLPQDVSFLSECPSVRDLMHQPLIVQFVRMQVAEVVN